VCGAKARFLHLGTVSDGPLKDGMHAVKIRVRVSFEFLEGERGNTCFSLSNLANQWRKPSVAYDVR